MKAYISINSAILTTNEILSLIVDYQPEIIINIGDKKKYIQSRYDYSSCEYFFGHTLSLVEEVISEVKKFIRRNQSHILQMYEKDEDLCISLRFDIILDGENTPDTFFDSDIIRLLSVIGARIDIDLRY